jgi:hypothetical protein
MPDNLLNPKMNGHASINTAYAARNCSFSQ